MVSSASSGFVSGGRAWGGAVVSRVSRSGWVWSFRAVRSGVSGSFAAPAAVCIPFSSRSLAVAWARGVAASLGWRCWARPGKRCASPFEVKVSLPAGLSARAARAQLPPLPSSLAALGV
jgi:hypothetical protein